MKNNKIRNFFLAVAFVDFVTLAMVAALFPALVLTKSSSLMPIEWSYSARIILVGVLMGIYPLGQFIASPIIGRLSDSYGRGKILSMTLAGSGLGLLFSVVSLSIDSVFLLGLGRFISGLAAGNISIAQAAMSDLSTADNKGRNISLLQMMMGLGWIVGPMFAGGLIAITPSISMGGIILFSVTALIFALLISYCLQFKTQISEIQNQQGGHGTKGKASTKGFVKIYIATWTLFVGGWMYFEQFIPSVLNVKWGLNPTEVGYALGLFASTYVVSNFFIVGNLLKILSARTLASCAFLLSGVALIGMSNSPSIVTFLIFGVLFIIGLANSVTAILVKISDAVPSQEQGSIFGITSSIQGAMTVIMAWAGGFFMAGNIDRSNLWGGILIILAWLVYELGSAKLNTSSNLQKNEGIKL